MQWLSRIILSKDAYTPPMKVTDDERQAAADAISHSAQVRARSTQTVNEWERQSAGAWGFHGSEDDAR